MAMDNNITVSGNLTRDPELRFTQSGTAMANLGVAVNRRYQQNGEWQEETSFFNVTCWAQLGENVAASLSKGDRAIIVGRLQQRSWETDGGEKRSVIELVADDVGGSLKWATTEVERTTREKPSAGSEGQRKQRSKGGGGGGGPVEDPFLVPASELHT